MASCTYEVKWNHSRIEQVISPFWLEMLNKCWRDLLDKGYQGNLKVIFQTGPSRSHKRLYGVYSDNKQCIHIYTYQRSLLQILMTIAHEFAHVEHMRIIPDGDRWDTEREEEFATAHEIEATAQLMVEYAKPLISLAVDAGRAILNAYQKWRANRVA